MNISLDCIENKTDIKKISLYSLLLIVCIAIVIAAPRMVEDKTSALFMAITCIGVVGALVALFNIIYRTKSKVYSATGSPIEQYCAYICMGNNDIKLLQNALNEGNIEMVLKHKSDERTNTLVDILYSADGRFGAYQISKYVPYQFEIVEQWKIQNNETMKSLVEALEKNTKVA